MRNDHSHGHGGGDHGPSVEILSQMGYETRDVSLNVLGKWLIFLAIFIIVMTGAAFGTYKILVPTYVEAEHSSTIPHVAKLPPYPQLQVDPHRDIMQFKQAEEDVISGSVASVPGGEKVNIPIAQAIDVMATDKGIAGEHGNTMRPAGEGYPGSGVYETEVPKKMADAAPVRDDSPSTPAGGEEAK